MKDLYILTKAFSVVFSTQLLVGRVQVLNPKAPGLSELFVICRRLLLNVSYSIPLTCWNFSVDILALQAIHMLEILLADRPPPIDINEVDPNGQAAVKRRLPQEVKQKLAKVARLSVCSSMTKSSSDSSMNTHLSEL